MSKDNVKVNTKWFKEKLLEVGGNETKLGRVIGTDASGAHRRLKGILKTTNEQAAKMADYFMVPLEEVLSNLGVKITEIESKGTVKVSGFVDSDFKIHFGEAKGPRVVPIPAVKGLSGKIKALRLQTADSKASMFDGGLVYYRETKKTDRTSLSPDEMGKLFVVEVDGGSWLFGSVRRGYLPGKYTVLSTDGRVLAEEVLLLRAYSVIWLRLG